VPEIDIPQAIVDLAVQRRGRLRLFEHVDPARTAHLIIDMQVGFTTPGAPAEISNAVAIIENVNDPSAACREAGVLNIFVQNTIDDEASPPGRTGSRRSGRRRSERECTPPSPKAAPATHCTPRSRPRTTTCGSTSTATNICCESTARGAMMLNYRVFFVCDATATHTDAEHNDTLATMLLTFADAINVEDMTAMLTK
jgi:ureidoacrylate peracid hydrolase